MSAGKDSDVKNKPGVTANAFEARRDKKRSYFGDFPTCMAAAQATLSGSNLSCAIVFRVC